MIYLDTFENRKKELLNEKLDKIADHVVYTGETAEVGGNVAFESIEQLGYIGLDPTSCSVDPSNITTAGEATRLEGVQSVDLKGKSATIDSTGTSHAPNDGDLYSAPVGGPPAIWYNIGGVVYKVAYNFQDTDHSIKVFGVNLKIVADPKSSVKEWTEGGEVFKPFFTEEQYQALLDLIS